MRIRVGDILRYNGRMFPAINNLSAWRYRRVVGLYDDRDMYYTTRVNDSSFVSLVTREDILNNKWKLLKKGTP